MRAFAFMTLQQMKYIVSALAMIQLLIALIGLYLIIRLIVTGWKNKDASKYWRAFRTFLSVAAILICILIIQFFTLLK